jgi:hypothetical protein
MGSECSSSKAESVYITPELKQELVNAALQRNKAEVWKLLKLGVPSSREALLAAVRGGHEAIVIRLVSNLPMEVVLEACTLAEELGQGALSKCMEVEAEGF